MKLFRKKEDRELSARQEQLATWCAARLLVGQRRLADWLNRQTADFSRRTCILLIGVCGLLAGAYCGWLVLGLLIH